MKKAKVEKKLRKLEAEVKDQLWDIQNPPLFKEGDKVLWYENPCWTGAPDDAPKPVKAVIKTDGIIMPSGFMKNLDDETGKYKYTYLCPHRKYFIEFKKGNSICLTGAFEHTLSKR